MMTACFNSATTVARYQAGSASLHLDRFVSWLADQGYKPASIRRHVRGAVQFSHWGELAKIPLNRTTLGSLHDCLAAQGRERYACGTYRHVYQSARVYVRFLEEIGEVRPPTQRDGKPGNPVSFTFTEFCNWMKAQRGTRDSTLANYRLPVTNLLRTLESPGACSASALRTFFLQQANPIHPEKSKNLATALRMFLRFLVVRGDCEPGLEFAIPTVARWRLSVLPKHIPATDVEALIASCDPSTVIGARDRAILLLIARIGLRAGDVSSLRLPHLFWSKGTVLVAGKNRCEAELPLPQEVGDAILHYLKHARPKLSNDSVFITTTAPLVPVTRQVVGRAVLRAIRRTGINAPSRGAHLLRHSAATTMLGEGLSLPAIGALLRHRSIETTAVYAKVDVNMLKEVAQPWPGVQPC